MYALSIRTHSLPASDLLLVELCQLPYRAQREPKTIGPPPSSERERERAIEKTPNASWQTIFACRPQCSSIQATCLMYLGSTRPEKRLKLVGGARLNFCVSGASEVSRRGDMNRNRLTYRVVVFCSSPFYGTINRLVNEQCHTVVFLAGAPLQPHGRAAPTIGQEAQQSASLPSGLMIMNLQVIVHRQDIQRSIEKINKLMCDAASTK